MSALYVTSDIFTSKTNKLLYQFLASPNREFSGTVLKMALLLRVCLRVAIISLSIPLTLHTLVLP